jgi:predicted dehydrogenase
MKKDLKKYNVAIIGCNGISGMYDPDFHKRKNKFSVTHAGAYYLNDKTNLVAACDTNLERLDLFCNFWNIDKRFLDLDEMLFSQKLDIVSICTPTETHAAIIGKLLNAGVKAIFCEKPLTDSFETASKLAQLCDDAGTKIIANYFRRWNTTLEKIKSDIDTQCYGEFIRGTFYYTKGLLGNASHLMDLANWFFGSPISISINDRNKKLFKDKYDSNKKDQDIHNIRANFSFHYKESQIIDFINVDNNNEYIFIECDLFFSHTVVNIRQRGQIISIRRITNDEIYNGFKILQPDAPFESDWKDAPTRAITELIRLIEDQEYKDGKLDDAVEVLSQIECIISQLKS